MGRFSDIFSSFTELAKDKLQLQNGIKNQEVQQSAPEIDIASLFEPELSMEELLGKNLPDARKWAALMVIRTEERARTKVEEAAKRAAEEQARAEAEEIAKRTAEEQARVEAEEAAKRTAEEQARAEAEAAKRADEEKAKVEVNIRPNGNTPAVKVKKQVREVEIASWRTKCESEEAAAISVQLDRDYRDIHQAIKAGANTLDELEAAIGRKIFIYCTEAEKHQILYPDPAEDMYECPDFAYYSNLKEILLPHGVTSIPERGFADCVLLEHIELPSSVVSIGDYAFDGCKSLKHIELPSSVVSIGVGAFNGCESLEHIELPSSIKSIGDHAFNICESLKHIELPSSIESIGYKAFNNTGMESITLPAGLKTLNYIGPVKYIDASQCRNVRSISKDTFNRSSVVYLPANVEELADDSVCLVDTVYAPATLRRVGKLWVKNMVCLSPILNSLSISKGTISLYVKDEYADSYVSRANREGVLNTKVEIFTRAVIEYFYDE